MRKRTALFVSLAVAVLLVGISVWAQVSRPYHNGSVWSVAFIRMKPGMDSAYMKYLATDWKKAQEAQKTEGVILSYKVLQTEGHTAGDWNLLLLTEYKNVASLEANEDKAEAIAQRVVGTDEKQMQGYRDRSEIREVMGERLAREIILEPRR